MLIEVGASCLPTNAWSVRCKAVLAAQPTSRVVDYSVSYLANQIVSASCCNLHSKLPREVARAILLRATIAANEVMAGSLEMLRSLRRRIAGTH